MAERKDRAVGVRLRMMPPADAHPAYQCIEVYDVDSGEPFGGVFYASMHYDCSGVISMSVDLFVSEITTLETPQQLPVHDGDEFSIEASLAADKKLVVEKAATMNAARDRRWRAR